MFERIDKEEDGEVYLREVVDFLKVLDNDIEQSNQVFRSHDHTCKRKIVKG